MSCNVMSCNVMSCTGSVKSKACRIWMASPSGTIHKPTTQSSFAVWQVDNGNFVRVGQLQLETWSDAGRNSCTPKHNKPFLTTRSCSEHILVSCGNSLVANVSNSHVSQQFISEQRSPSCDFSINQQLSVQLFHWFETCTVADFRSRFNLLSLVGDPVWLVISTDRI